MCVIELNWSLTVFNIKPVCFVLFCSERLWCLMWPKSSICCAGLRGVLLHAVLYIVQRSCDVILYMPVCYNLQEATEFCLSSLQLFVLCVCICISSVAMLVSGSQLDTLGACQMSHACPCHCLRKEDIYSVSQKKAPSLWLHSLSSLNYKSKS